MSGPNELASELLRDYHEQAYARACEKARDGDAEHAEAARQLISEGHAPNVQYSVVFRYPSELFEAIHGKIVSAAEESGGEGAPDASGVAGFNTYCTTVCFKGPSHRECLNNMGRFLDEMRKMYARGLGFEINGPYEVD